MATPEQKSGPSVAGEEGAPRRKSRQWIGWTLLVLGITSPFAVRQGLVWRAEARVEKAREGLGFDLVPATRLSELWGPRPDREDNAAPLYAEMAELLAPLIEDPEELYNERMDRLDWDETLNEEQYDQREKELLSQRQDDERLQEECRQLLVAWGVEEPDTEPRWSDEEQAMVVPPPVPARDADRLRRFLAQEPIAAALRLRDEALARSGFRRDIDWSAWPSIEYDLMTIGTTAQVTMLEGELAASEKRWADAFRAVERSFLMARHLEQESLLLQHLVCKRIRDEAIDQALGFCHLHAPSAETAARLAEASRWDGPCVLRRSVVSECVIGNGVFEDCLAGRKVFLGSADYLLLWAIGWNIMEAQAVYLQYNGRCIRATELPPREMLGEIKHASVDFDRATEDSWWFGGMLLSLLGMEHTTAYESLLRHHAKVRMFEASLAASARREATGEYPQTLADLAGADGLPKDPFSGELFHYRREGEGFILWSVGPDGDDDGGVTNDELGDKAKDDDDGDIVLRVPPKARP